MARSVPSMLGPDAENPVCAPNKLKVPARLLDWELPPFVLAAGSVRHQYHVASASPVPAAVIEIRSYSTEGFSKYVNETVGRLFPQRLKAYPDFLPIIRNSSCLPVAFSGWHQDVHILLGHQAGSDTPVRAAYQVPVHVNQMPSILLADPSHLSSFREYFKTIIFPTTDYALRALRAGQALRRIDPLDLDLPQDKANLDHLQRVRKEEEPFQRAYLWKPVDIEENAGSPAAKQLSAWLYGPSHRGPQIEFQGRAVMVACPPWTMNDAEFLELTQARTLDLNEEDDAGLGATTSATSTSSTVIINKIALCCGRNKADYFIFTNGNMWTFGHLTHDLEGTVTIAMSSALSYNSNLTVEDPVPYTWPESREGVFKPARGAGIFAVICCWMHEAMTSEKAVAPVAPPPPPAQRQKVKKSSAQSRFSGQSSTPTALSPPGLTKSRANVPSGASSATHSTSNAIPGPSNKGPGKRSFTEAIGNNEHELDGAPKKIPKLSVDDEAAVGVSSNGKEQTVVASINTEAGPSELTGPEGRTVKSKKGKEKEQEILSLPPPDLSQMVPTISPAAVTAPTRPNTRKAARAVKAEIESDHVVPRRSTRVQILNEKKAEGVSPPVPTPKQAKKVAKKASTGVTKEKAVRGKRVKAEPAPSGDDGAAPAPSPLIRKSVYGPVLKRGRGDEDEGDADEDGTPSKRARTDAGPSRALHQCQFTTPAPAPLPSPAPPPPEIENDTMEVDDASPSTLHPAIATVDNAMDVDEPELPPPDVQVPSRHIRDRRQPDRLTPTFAVAKRKGAAAAGRARRKDDVPPGADAIKNGDSGMGMLGSRGLEATGSVLVNAVRDLEVSSVDDGAKHRSGILVLKHRQRRCPRDHFRLSVPISTPGGTHLTVLLWQAWEYVTVGPLCRVELFGFFPVEPASRLIGRRFLENTVVGFHVGRNASDFSQWTQLRSFGGTLRIPPSGVTIASYRRRFLENITTSIYVGWNTSDSSQWTQPRSIISSRSLAHVLARELLLPHFPLLSSSSRLVPPMTATHFTHQLFKRRTSSSTLNATLEPYNDLLSDLNFASYLTSSACISVAILHPFLVYNASHFLHTSARIVSSSLSHVGASFCSLPSVVSLSVVSLSIF